MLWLREILSAREQQANRTTEGPDQVIQEQLFRATDELCETRILAAEMHARNDELERQMLEITTAYKARLAESEGERERALAIAKKERRALAKLLSVAKEENEGLGSRLQAAASGGGPAAGPNGRLPEPASVAEALAAAAAARPQGDF